MTTPQPKKPESHSSKKFNRYAIAYALIGLSLIIVLFIYLSTTAFNKNVNDTAQARKPIATPLEEPKHNPPPPALETRTQTQER